MPVIGLATGLAACGAAPVNEPAGRPAVGVPISPLSIRTSAEGHMLDFRYQVTDPAKAQPLVGPGSRPVLVHRRTGTELMVPALGKVGPLRSGLHPEAGRNYFILFANPGQLVKPGDVVAIRLRPAELPEMEVQ